MTQYIPRGNCFYPREIVGATFVVNDWSYRPDRIANDNHFGRGFQYRHHMWYTLPWTFDEFFHEYELEGWITKIQVFEQPQTMTKIYQSSLRTLDTSSENMTSSICSLPHVVLSDCIETCNLFYYNTPFAIHLSALRNITLVNSINCLNDCSSFAATIRSIRIYIMYRASNYMLPDWPAVLYSLSTLQQLNSLGIFMYDLTKPVDTNNCQMIAEEAVRVKYGDLNFDWCVVLNFHKKAGEKPTYTIDVLAHLTSDSVVQKSTSDLQPCPLSEKGEMKAIPIQHTLIRDISAIRVYLPDDLRTKDARQSVLKSVQEIKRRHPLGLPLLDPIKDMDIKSNEMLSCVKQYSTLQTRINEHPLTKTNELKYLYEQYERKANLERQVLEAKNDLKKAQSLLQIGDLKKYKRVLRRLGYCNSTDIIDLKGRVACEIDTGDELVTTELLFNGVFNDLTVSQACALLSCFVFQEKGNEMPKLPQELSGPLRLMQETARRVARVSIESKIDMDEERYVDGFKPYMMDVVKAWVDGQSFASICQMTSIYEGSIIRCIRRLEELLRQMCCAAKAIGNSELEVKFTEGTQKIKRDIIFAASLYL
ncbi:unnamed protein product [Rotaria sp. Silwood1]|nr:unnamed protein product [Rotaria sp. Silwood1]